MPHVDTQTWLTGSRIDEVWQEHRKMKDCRYARQSRDRRIKLERQQAKETSAGATKQKVGFKRWVATKVTSADATRQKTGIKRSVETKVTSADAASSSPSAVPPPRFKVEITWSDDKVGDGDRWFV